MARMNLASGLCPICGRTVARTLTTHHGIATEAYHCPEHGRRAATSGMTVLQWCAPVGSWLPGLPV
jgi:hypothetical protein